MGFVFLKCEDIDEQQTGVATCGVSCGKGALDGPDQEALDLKQCRRRFHEMLCVWL